MHKAEKGTAGSYDAVLFGEALDEVLLHFI